MTGCEITLRQLFSKSVAQVKLFIGSIYKRISGTAIGSNKADSRSFKSREEIQSELESGQLGRLNLLLYYMT